MRRLSSRPQQGSYSALAASVPAAAKATPGGCNVLIGPASEGIENPVLPCGIRLYLSYRGRSVLASVIGRGPASAGTEFGLTAALARAARPERGAPHRLELRRGALSGGRRERPALLKHPLAT